MKSYIRVLNKEFKTLTQLKSYIKNIKDRYNPGEFLNKEDYVFMLEALKRHEDYEIKKGVGIKNIYLKNNIFYGKVTKGFWLTRLDNTTTDFSYLMLCKRNKESVLTKFKSACRKAVEQDILDFKKCEFYNSSILTCPITNNSITFKTSHVDHAPPNTFETIIISFIKKYNINVDELNINYNKDGVIGNILLDKHILSKFIQYHKEKANLRIVSINANLSLIKKNA